MKRIIAIVINYFNKNYFTNKSYAHLSWWGIKDVFNNRLMFKTTTEPKTTNINSNNLYTIKASGL